MVRYYTDEEIKRELQWRKYEEACRKDEEKWDKIGEFLKKALAVTLVGDAILLKVL